MAQKATAPGAGDAEDRKAISSGAEPAFRNKIANTSLASRNTRAIADIRIGKRFRRYLGDIDALAASIAAIGLLNPITINEEFPLLGEMKWLTLLHPIKWPTC